MVQEHATVVPDTVVLNFAIVLVFFNRVLLSVCVIAVIAIAWVRSLAYLPFLCSFSKTCRENAYSLLTSASCAIARADGNVYGWAGKTADLSDFLNPDTNECSASLLNCSLRTAAEEASCVIMVLFVNRVRGLSFSS